MNSCTFYLSHQTVGNHEIVNTPAGILLTSLKAVGPPRISNLIGMEGTECILETTGEKCAELLTLLICEASIMTIVLRILDVYLLVRNIEVATENNRLHRIELLEIMTEVSFPRHAIVKTLETVLRVWSVTTDQVELRHFEGDNTSFVVVLFNTNTIFYTERLMLRKNGCSGIALLVSIIPVAFITVEMKVKLPSLHLGLLQTKEISVHLSEDVAESFSFTSPEAINVPGNKFHIIKFSLSELSHLDSHYSTLIAFISQPSTCTVFSLLQVIGGQKSKDYWNVIGGIETCNTLRDSLTDVIKMRSLTADDTAEDDDSIITVVEGHLAGTVNQFERTWHGFHMYILRQSAVLLECINTPLKQGACDFRIPLSNNDAEDHVRCIGDFREVVVAKVM